MSCAPSRMFVFKMAFDTSDSAVNGGQMTMSTSLTLNSSRFKPFTRSSASATVLFIFQLPAIMSLRFLFIVAGRRFRCSAPSFVCQCRDARQHFAFEKFQACAAAGADERHLLGEAGHVQRLHTVAAPDDACGTVLLSGFGDRACDGERPFRKAWIFEHAHWPVPKDRLCRQNVLAVLLEGLGADIQTAFRVG